MTGYKVGLSARLGW